MLLLIKLLLLLRCVQAAGSAGAVDVNNYHQQYRTIEAGSTGEF